MLRLAKHGGKQFRNLERGGGATSLGTQEQTKEC